MESPLATYKQIVQEQMPLEEEAFQDLLAKGRKGDDSAYRLISAGCLKTCLDLVEKIYPHLEETKRLEIVQEGNAAMMAAIATFSGKKYQDLNSHIERAVMCRLQLVAI